MNTKTFLVGVAAITAGVAFFAPQAEAYRGDPSVKGPNYTAERHEAMLKAFQTGDYAAWKNLMQGRGRVTQVINESNFARFSEAHRLALEGKTAEAAKIRAELGLGLQNGAGKGQGQNRWNR